MLRHFREPVAAQAIDLPRRKSDRASITTSSVRLPHCIGSTPDGERLLEAVFNCIEPLLLGLGELQLRLMQV